MSSKLYNCDYRELTKKVWQDAVVITDPPYGIGFKYASHSDKGGEDYQELLRPLAGSKMAVLQYPEEMMASLVPLFGAPDDCLAWCYNSNLNRQFRLWGIWGIKLDFKAVKQPYKNPKDKRVRALIESGSEGTRSYDWFSDIQLCKNVLAQKTQHPCQLPEALVDRVIKLCGTPKLVFDPFMGSGTTGAICKKLGIDFIGCEIDPMYFQISENRINQRIAA